MPRNAEERALCMQLNLSCSDCQSACRDCFHPKDNMAGYAGQKDEAAAAVKVFCQEGGRFDKWIHHFANFIKVRQLATGKAGGFLFGRGDKISYAEAHLYHMIDAMRS